MTGAERHVCCSAFGECYLLTAKQYHTRVPAGGISALAYGIIHYIQTRPTRKTSAIAAHCKNSRPPKPTKNFPQEHPPQTKRNKSSQCKGGCSWGKFSVREGGLEGRETPPKGVSLRLQGLPPHPTTGYPAAVCAPMRSSQSETISSFESSAPVCGSIIAA